MIEESKYTSWLHMQLLTKITFPPLNPKNRLGRVRQSWNEDKRRSLGWSWVERKLIGNVRVRLVVMRVSALIWVEESKENGTHT